MEMRDSAILILAIYTVCVIVGFFLPKFLGKPRYAIAAISFLPTAFIGLYYSHTVDDWLFYYRVRTLPYFEISGALIGLGAGILVRDMYGRRMFVAMPTAALALAVVSLLPYWKPILTPLNTESLQDRRDGDYCLQSAGSTCGPACLATILNLSGTRVSEEEIAKNCLTSSSGTEVWYLARYAKEKGLDPRYEQVPPSSLNGKRGIVGVRLGPGGAGHFLAILDCDKDILEFVDPIKGHLKMSVADFLKSYEYTGFMLVLQ